MRVEVRLGPHALAAFRPPGCTTCRVQDVACRGARGLRLRLRRQKMAPASQHTSCDGRGAPGSYHTVERYCIKRIMQYRLVPARDERGRCQRQY